MKQTHRLLVLGIKLVQCLCVRKGGIEEYLVETVELETVNDGRDLLQSH